VRGHQRHGNLPGAHAATVDPATLAIETVAMAVTNSNDAAAECTVTGSAWCEGFSYSLTCEDAR
jgi:hypothetical protein